MQYHSEFNHHRSPSRDRTPWNIAERSGEPRVIDVTRGFVELRERLLPYLTSEASKAIRAGTSLMRPLYFDYPSDPEVWDHPLQWMLGDDLLVAPVLEPGVRSWDVYLPDGDWVDAFTGLAVEGGQVVSRVVPIDELPVYVRASAWRKLAVVFGQ
jgi:alpha-glucosidase (family GH31 glycosyl hydrolase)